MHNKTEDLSSLLVYHLKVKGQSQSRKVVVLANVGMDNEAHTGLSMARWRGGGRETIEAAQLGWAGVFLFLAIVAYHAPPHHSPSAMPSARLGARSRS